MVGQRVRLTAIDVFSRFRCSPLVSKLLGMVGMGVETTRRVGRGVLTWYISAYLEDDISIH